MSIMSSFFKLVQMRIGELILKVTVCGHKTYRTRR